MSIKNDFNANAPEGKSASLMILRCMGKGCASEDEIDKYVEKILVNSNGIFDLVEFTKRVGKPVFQQMKKIGDGFFLKKNKVRMKDINLRQNLIETSDSLLKSLSPSYKSTFYDVGLVSTTEYPTLAGMPGVLYAMNFFIDAVKISHSREVYNILDLIGDLGGVLEVIIFVFGVFLFPISEFSFVMKALEKLYLARTSHSTLLKRD